MIGIGSDKKRAEPAKLTWIRQHPKEYIKRSSSSLDSRIDTHIAEGTANGWVDKLMQNITKYKETILEYSGNPSQSS